MKLAQIPKEPQSQEKPVVEDVHPLEEAVSQDDDADLTVYGLHPSDPNYKQERDRLRAIKKRDPAFFKKMQSLD